MQHNKDTRQLQEENKELKDALHDYQEELMDKKGRIQDLEVAMIQMSSFFIDLLGCMPPSRIYSYFLKEQWCHFWLKLTREHRSYKSETPNDFFDMCEEVTS